SAAANVANVPGTLSGAAAMFASDGTAYGDRAHGAFHGFLEGHEDVPFDITSLFGRGSSFFKPGSACATKSRARSASAHGSEKLLEEVAEARAAELKVEFLASISTARVGAPAAEGFQTGRRPEISARIPVS